MFLYHFLAIKKKKFPEGEFLLHLPSGCGLKAQVKKWNILKPCWERYIWFFTPKKLHWIFWPARCNLGEVLLCVVKIHSFTEQSFHKVSYVVRIWRFLFPLKLRWGMFWGKRVQTLLNILVHGHLLGTSLKRQFERCAHSCVFVGKVGLRIQNREAELPDSVHSACKTPINTSISAPRNHMSRKRKAFNIPHFLFK